MTNEQPSKPHSRMRRISNPVTVSVHSFSDACGPITKPGKMTRVSHPVKMTVHPFSITTVDLSRSNNNTSRPALLITIQIHDGENETNLPRTIADLIKLLSAMEIELGGHGLDLDETNSREDRGMITFRLQPRLQTNVESRLEDVRERILQQVGEK